jgi:hypothetical protein
MNSILGFGRQPVKHVARAFIRINPSTDLFPSHGAGECGELTRQDRPARPRRTVRGAFFCGRPRSRRIGGALPRVARQR